MISNHQNYKKKNTTRFEWIRIHIRFHGFPWSAVDSDPHPIPRLSLVGRGFGLTSDSTAFLGRPWIRIHIRFHGFPWLAVDSDPHPIPRLSLVGRLLNNSNSNNQRNIPGREDLMGELERWLDFVEM